METKCCIYFLEMSTIWCSFPFFLTVYMQKENLSIQVYRIQFKVSFCIGQCLVLAIGKTESLNHFKPFTANMFIQAHDWKAWTVGPVVTQFRE